MPISPGTLGSLIQTNVNGDMTALTFGAAPLGQPNPSYFITMCNAIATGMASGSPLINFTTADSGSAGAPLVTGTGTGIGIIVDAAFFKQDLYTRARAAIIARFGTTRHDPYPPGLHNSGELLLALCKGIADSVATHFTTAWTLNSTHPQIYVGTGLINNGHFSGLSAGTIAPLIQAAAPSFIGVYWPDLCQAIAESYVETIHNHSTGTVTITGTCVPGPSQVCGIGSSGTGTGVAT